MASSTTSFDDNRFNAANAAENDSQYYQHVTVVTTRRIPAQNTPRGRVPFAFETTTEVLESWVDHTLAPPASMVRKNRPAISTAQSIASTMPPLATTTLNPFANRTPPSTLPTPSRETAASPLKPTTPPIRAPSTVPRQPFTFPGPSPGPSQRKPSVRAKINNVHTRAAAVQEVFSKYKANQLAEGRDAPGAPEASNAGEPLLFPGRVIEISDDE